MNQGDISVTEGSVRVAMKDRRRGFKILKRMVQSLAFVLILPRLCSYLLATRLLGKRCFGASSESIARIPGTRGVFLRHAFYRNTLFHCGQDVYFGWNSVFSMNEAEIGDRVYIGRYCSIGFAAIGEAAMLADHVQILSGGQEHGRSPEHSTMHEQDQMYRRVSIGRGAWIGAGAVIMADVGAGAIVGAGAVVNRPIPGHSVAVGVPAKVVKRLSENRKFVEAERSLAESNAESAARTSELMTSVKSNGLHAKTLCESPES